MKKRSFIKIITVAVLLCLLLPTISLGSVFAAELVDKVIKDDLLIDPDVSIKDKIDGPIKEPIVTPIIPGVWPSIRPEEPEEPEEPLPEAYSLRDDYILLAQHQDKNGYCWNFAATMAAATTLMRATNEYYDFSELWTGITCYTPKKTYSKLGAGGTFSYQYKTMQKYGLMLECDLPYELSPIVSNENAADYYAYFSKYANDDLSSLLISDSDTSYSRSEVDEIKKHIYKNGSLYMAFSFSTGFIEDENGVFAKEPNQKKTTGSHAVSVIGWDDNYEKTYYPEGSDTPVTYKGAWMILNSYTETNGNDGISMVFYEDTNVSQIVGYRYEKDTSKTLYFYDKIEAGYAYPTSVKGKYHGDLVAESAETRQFNIFYDDVALEYSYEISLGASILGIEIYLDGKNVTKDFSISIDKENSRFYIEREKADYGNYKVLVSYGNDQATDTYLNNFFVTYGLIGEELEFDADNNSLGFATGKDLEYYSFTSANKSYVIYTNKLSGSVSFIPIEQSVYSEVNMSMPTVSYEITNGISTTVKQKIASPSGYELVYTFKIIYCDDSTMQPVRVYYDLDGGVNHAENYDRELANEAGGLILYEPTRAGYTFAGWYIETEDGGITVTKSGDGYVVAWESIDHMGDAPTMFASSYYKQYYNNTNTLFVRALWEQSKQTVSWVNWDGSVIAEESYIQGENPIFSGNYPERPDDERYTYTFAGWAPLSVAISGNATLEALYTATPKEYGITVTHTDGGKVIDSGKGSINCLGTRTLVFAPAVGYKVKNVTLNGTSLGAIASYTLADVCADQILSVEFEKDPDKRMDTISLVLIIVLGSAFAISTTALVILLLKNRKPKAGGTDPDDTDGEYNDAEGDGSAGNPEENISEELNPEENISEELNPEEETADESADEFGESANDGAVDDSATESTDTAEDSQSTEAAEIAEEIGEAETAESGEEIGTSETSDGEEADAGDGDVTATDEKGENN